MRSRPTDEEFKDLKRKRAEAVRAAVKAFCDEHGWDSETVQFHSADTDAICYCACPDGPCQHIWDGPQYESEDGCMFSATCSRCDAVAAFHDLRCAP